MHGDWRPQLRTSVPGPCSRQWAGRLALCESPDTTYLADDFPIFWERAAGCNVWDADGNRYLDLTAAFGVCTLGHANPELVAVIAKQTAALLHAMGDVHPSGAKLALAEALARHTPGDLCQTVFGLNGSDAIEAALKTAMLRTGRPGVLAFTHGYHGLGYGALAVTWRRHFRQPFAAQLNPHVQHVPFPDPLRRHLGGRDAAEEASRAAECVDEVLSQRNDVGCVVVEPVQGRGGCIVPHPNFLQQLREVCTRRGVLLVLDEILTGLGRTGAWFACEHSEVVPDLLCVGKSLAGGMPLSACIGLPEVMQAWGRSRGEARHTSTFLGHPLACAAALCHLTMLERDGWIARTRERGPAVGALLSPLRGIAGVADVRGLGFMWGVELVASDGRPDAARAFDVVCRLLRRGILVLASGSNGNVLQLTPPFVLPEEAWHFAVEALQQALQETA